MVKCRWKNADGKIRMEKADDNIGTRENKLTMFWYIMGWVTLFEGQLTLTQDKS